MTSEADRNGDPTPWQDSPAYAKAKKDRMLTVIVGCIGLLAAALAWAVPTLHKEAPGLTTVGPAWFTIAVSVTFFRYFTALRRFQEKQESAVGYDGSAATGFPDELKLSRREMAKNRLIYGNQARNADRNSQAAMILGFIFITGFAGIAFATKAPSSRAFFASISVIGATYSAYISKTFNTVRESALERYDRVTFMIELEDAFLRAERMIRDTKTLTKSERLILMKEIFKTRLRAIQIILENSGQIGNQSDAHGRRMARAGRRQTPNHPSPVSGPPINMSSVRSSVQEAVEAILLSLGSRLALDGAAGIEDEDEDEE